MNVVFIAKVKSRAISVDACLLYQPNEKKPVANEFAAGFFIQWRIEDTSRTFRRRGGQACPLSS